MALYVYRGRNDAGELVTGRIDATSVDGVAGQLLGRGVTPIAIEESKPAAQLSLKMPALFQPKVSEEDLVMFSRQMYSLTRSGVVINRAVRGLADSTKNPRLREVLLEIETTLNSGVTLSVALRRHPDVFDPLYVNIVQVGENSGRLDLVFQQLAFYLQREKDTRRQVKSAMQYPTFVMIAIGIALVVLNIFVIPVFADLFSKFGADLPLPTKILIGTSNFFVSYWPLLLVALLGAVFGTRYYVNTDSGRLLWDRKKLRIPLIGSILERSTLARFGRSFSMMLRAGVPLIQGLEQSAQAVDNRYLGNKIREMRRGVERGESLLRIATKSAMFTPLVLQMIAVGEETGQVDELLDEVAEFYEQEVDYDVKNLSAYIEPLLISCIAGLVMILALGIFLPMWDMLNVMQG